jgi:hypothetical protein
VRRILLDQNLAHALKTTLNQDVAHAFDMGWAKLENGALLAAAEQAGFDVFLSADRNLGYQQNLTGRRIAVVILSTNHWPTLRAAIEQIAEAIAKCEAGGYVEVSLPQPALRRRPRPESKET